MINFGGRKKKTTFCVRIFDISHCVFIQISIGRARWMWNFIPHPTSTHTAYFWWTPLPQKQEIPEKTWWWCHHHVFSEISFFWGSGVCQNYAVGIRWMQNQIPHPTSSPDRNLSKNTGRYVKNMNTKGSFFLSSSKINQYYFIILTIILLFSLGGPF